MNPRAIKAKGRDAENAIVAFIRAHGWPHAERRRLTGILDRGDITGVADVVIESKSGAVIKLSEWLRETEKERINDGATYGALVIKLKGVGDTRAHEWPVMLPLGQFVRLLRESGRGLPLEQEENDA